MYSRSSKPAFKKTPSRKIMKKKTQSYPLTQLAPHDFVLINGKVGQLIPGFGFDVDLEEPADGKIIIAPIKLVEADLAIVKKKLKMRDRTLNFRYSAQGGGFYIDIQNQTPEFHNFVSVQCNYYHELQQALRCAGCAAELNYHWAERENKNKDNNDNQRPEANS